MTITRQNENLNDETYVNMKINEVMEYLRAEKSIVSVEISVWHFNRTDEYDVSCMIYSKKEDEAYEVLFDTYQYNREYAVKRRNDIAMKMMQDKNMQNYLRENKIHFINYTNIYESVEV